MQRAIFLMSAFLILGFFSSVSAQTLTVIANTDTIAPGGNNGGSFVGFNETVIDNGRIVFRGQDGNSNGLFSSNNGVLTRVVDSSTNVPGETATFSNFSGTTQRASISNGSLAFTSLGSASGGVYTINENGQIDAIVRSQESVPGHNNSTFASFAGQHIDNGNIVFRGGFGPFRVAYTSLKTAIFPK